MHRSLTKTLAGAGVLATSVGFILALGTSSASAATTPPYEGTDPNAIGTITLYDASGNVVTGGSVNDKPIAAYAVGSAVDRAGDTTANLIAAQPNPNANIGLWNKDFMGAFTHYPLTTGPANVVSASQSKPVATGAATDLSVADFIGEFPNTQATDSNTSYQDLYQLRLYSANAAGAQTAAYNTADILVNETTNTWTQVYPAPLISTTTALAASPSPATTGSNVTLTATITAADSSSPAGTVQFKDGSTNLGTPVTVSGGTASFSSSSLAAGSHSLSAIFTPSGTTYNGSTGTTTLAVNNPVPGTTTSLAVGGSPTQAGSDTTLTATVSPSSAPGSVAFYDGSSTTPIAGTVTNPSAGTYLLDLPTGFAAGSHSIVAKFTPTDPTAFAASQSAAQSFLTQPAQTGACAQSGSQCTTVANIQATVPTGTLVINTPYTTSNVLNLGTLALSADSKLLTGSAAFNNIVVTDTRSGNLAYTVSAQATNMTDGKTNPGSTINAENLGLTQLASTSGTGFTGNVVVTQNPAASGVAPTDTGTLGLGGASHTIATADHGLGTMTLNGLLSLNAPSSTEPGIFTGTITFTVG